MSTGLISLAAGVLIGLMYAVLKVRSPAPPALALIGLLGMLAGEQATRRLLSRDGAPPPKSFADGSVVMKAWIISLVCGVGAGVIYALLDVHSPAPPVVALLGLFGMLVGEQLIPVGRRLLSREPLTLAWFRHECVPKISGTAPPAPAKDTRDVK